MEAPRPVWTGTQPLPDSTSIKAALSLPLQTSSGSTTTLSTIFEYYPKANGTAITTIFIRHFYCGNCKDYLQALSAYKKFAVDPAKVIIIGCGDRSLIKSYKADTGPCPYEVLTDPTGAIYDKLGFGSSLELGTKPKYVKSGVLAGAIRGAINALKGGVKKGGDIRRNGGEFVWVDSLPRWCHRMETSRGHFEIEKLEDVVRQCRRAGVEEGPGHLHPPEVEGGI